MHSVSTLLALSALFDPNHESWEMPLIVHDEQFNAAKLAPATQSGRPIWVIRTLVNPIKVPADVPYLMPFAVEYQVSQYLIDKTEYCYEQILNDISKKVAAHYISELRYNYRKALMAWNSKLNDEIAWLQCQLCKNLQALSGITPRQLDRMKQCAINEIFVQSTRFKDALLKGLKPTKSVNQIRALVNFIEQTGISFGSLLAELQPIYPKLNVKPDFRLPSSQTNQDRRIDALSSALADLMLHTPENSELCSYVTSLEGFILLLSHFSWHRIQSLSESCK